MNFNFQDCFLHFLDRELLETQGTYNKIVERSIANDIRFILLSSPKDLILSASFLFESKYAYAVFEEFYSFFMTGKFVVATTYNSLAKMIASKQEQYKGKNLLFPNYFNDLWQVLAESSIMFVPKRENTTLYIANDILTTNRIYNILEEKNNVPYLQEAIQNRGNQAITHHLLNPTYQKRGISIRDQDSVNTLVTESYIRSYMDYFDATIPSGLSCGIYTYDYLSANTPLSNVFFWIKLYKQIGLFYFTSTCSIELLQMIVTSNEQLTFLCSVRTWISTELCEKYLNSDIGLIRLISKLKKRSDITMLNFNLYLNRICLVTEEIENLSIHKMKEETSMAEKEKTVFVVHGRNLNIKRNVFAFLRSLDIYPLEWEGAVKMTNKGAPSTLEVIKAGMKNSKGIIVIFTGDDEAKLKEEFWEEGENFDYEPQPRQNVLVEAGMAMALYPNSTIIVRIGKQRSISDLAGINYIDLTDQPEKRQAFISRLKTIGLNVDDIGSDWLYSGKFNL